MNPVAEAVAASRNGTVFTFYSYKGGVGRSMALANVAALLSQRRKRVLVIDWDLEAPGIEKYFQSWLRGSRATTPGVVDLIDGFRRDAPLDWRRCLLAARPFPNGEELSILSAGQSGPDYADRMRGLDWGRLFDEQDLGAYLEQLRAEWADAYDFVLIDSRTGITDIGGICTIHLPDVLVALFTANEQSLEGVREVILRARSAHAALPVDRRSLLVVPVPARDESRRVLHQGWEWQGRYAELLGEFYADWLPKEVAPGEAVKLLKIPYVADWSFGEQLPVVLEGTTDPQSLGFAYELLTRLIVSQLTWSELTQGVLAAASAVSRADNATRIAVDLAAQVKQAEQVAESSVTAAQQASQQAAASAAQARKVKSRALIVTLSLVLLVAAIIGAAVVQRRSAERLEAEMREKRQRAIIDSTNAIRDPLQATLRLLALPPDQLLGQPVPAGVVARLSADVPWAELHHEGRVQGACFSPDGATLATASTDGHLRFFSTSGTGDPAVRDPGSGTGVALRALDCSVNFRRLITVGADGAVGVFDGGTRKLLHRYEVGTAVSARLDPWGTSAVAISPMIYPREGQGRVLRLGLGQPDFNIASVAGAWPTYSSWRFSADGRWLIGGKAGAPPAAVSMKSPDATPVFFGSRLGSLTLGSELTQSFVTEDGVYVATASAAEIELWSTASLRVAARDKARFDGGVKLPLKWRLATFAGSSSWIALAYPGGLIEIYHTGMLGKAKEPFYTLQAPSGDVNEVLLGPGPGPRLGGDALLTLGPGDPSLRKITDGSEQRRLGGHSAAVLGATFSPDGRFIATWSADKTVRLWKTAPPSPLEREWSRLLKQLDERTTACLLPPQRVQILGETKEDARAPYEVCETKYGRTPRSDQAIERELAPELLSPALLFPPSGSTLVAPPPPTEGNPAPDPASLANPSRLPTAPPRHMQQQQNIGLY